MHFPGCGVTLLSSQASLRGPLPCPLLLGTSGLPGSSSAVQLHPAPWCPALSVPPVTTCLPVSHQPVTCQLPDLPWEFPVPKLL